MIADPRKTSPISLYSVSDQLESMCEAFEDKWKKGTPAAIEEFLAAVPAELHEKLLPELVALDMAHRIQQGEHPTSADYIERFPDFREQIESIRLDPQKTSTVRHKPAPVPAAAHAVGRRVGHYVLLERVGGGAFGEVWKARDTQLDRLVAVKIPHPEFRRQAHGLALREGRAAAQLKHPNIVAVHSIEERGELLLIVSDFINGPNLKRWLRKNPPTFAQTAELCAKLAEALHHAHERGVIHRDLKPSNVLMDAAAEPHIADFGLAKNVSAEESISAEGKVVGTPAYMSPEQARGQSGRVDAKADVFALGVMLYEMLSGEQPFQGEQSSVLRAVVQDQPPPLRRLRREIPRDLETICLKSMEKDPARRYASAQEMAVDLRRFLRGDAILARRPGIAERSWRWARKRPATVSSMVLALVAVVGLAMAAYLAQANRALLGLRPVLITTDPPGARLALAPLHPVTGEPDESAVIFARGRTPTRIDLKPGDYFVVALLDDGRFHEVYRRVPERYEGLPGIFHHQRWKLTDKGEVKLPRIGVPDLSTTDDMALFEGDPEFESPIGSGENAPRRRKHVRSFYMDCHEFTVAQYRDSYVRTSSLEMEHSNWRPVPDDHALTVNYERALSLAERKGKRLPFADEFEYAATYGGVVSSSSTESESRRTYERTEFGPVGTPQSDRIESDKPVWGLRSNVAEWTATRIGIPQTGHQGDWNAILGDGLGAHFVCGGDAEVIEGRDTMRWEDRNPRIRLPVSRYQMKPGVGFRCVRSAQPRFFSVE